ncbi:Cytochrome c oxidase assembly factor 6-like [Holothuria leucospilota]|uniref:Cytochrome c oxidase assembly factor 6-like n=1 Tax=Holothuria leucospilota TaxID=206669 RepID=A0A9Q1CHV9_HOLLE|nr:Cytochrome c oxidase assembly factor 6-like [Holothuria leucospilota]
MSSQKAAPTAAERKVCHSSRDAFFACLDKQNDNENKCLKEKQMFEQSCPKSWVKYFCRRRDYLKYSERLGTEGFVPKDEET